MWQSSNTCIYAWTERCCTILSLSNNITLYFTVVVSLFILNGYILIWKPLNRGGACPRPLSGLVLLVCADCRFCSLTRCQRDWRIQIIVVPFTWSQALIPIEENLRREIFPFHVAVIDIVTIWHYLTFTPLFLAPAPFRTCFGSAHAGV